MQNVIDKHGYSHGYSHKKKKKKRMWKVDAVRWLFEKGQFITKVSMIVSHWILKDGLPCVLQQERFLRSVSLSAAGFKNLLFFNKLFFFFIKVIKGLMHWEQKIPCFQSGICITQITHLKIYSSPPIAALLK